VDGDIALTGTGGSGTNGNLGVSLAANSRLSTVDGDLRTDDRAARPTKPRHALTVPW
jgi:hypothetical protein